MSEIGILSSGDEEKDRIRLERAARHQAELDAGRCPNGHGEMFKASERQSECTECGFLWQRSAIF